MKQDELSEELRKYFDYSVVVKEIEKNCMAVWHMTISDFEKGNLRFSSF